MVMPVPRVEIGAVLAFRDTASGAVAWGCVQRREGHRVQLRLLELARRHTRGGGSGMVGRRMALHSEGGRCTELDLEEQRWSRIDTAGEDDAARARLWMARRRQADYTVQLVSTTAHLDMAHQWVAPLASRVVQAQLPDADVGRLRDQLEGVGKGTGSFVQLRGKYLSAGEGEE